MNTAEQRQLFTVILAARVHRADPEPYTIRCGKEHAVLQALQKRGLVTYAGERAATLAKSDAPEVNGASTWTATDLLRERIAELVRGEDVSAEPDGYRCGRCDGTGIQTDESE